MRKGIFVGMAALLAVTAFAQAANTPIFSDNFEGYADDAAFKAVWNNAAGPLSSLAVGGGKNGGNGVVTSGGAVASKALGLQTIPTTASGNAMVLEADMWDYSTGGGDRNSIGIRQGTGVLFEFGEYNAMDPDLAVTGSTSAQGYGFRVLGTGPQNANGGAMELQSWVLVVPNANKTTSADPAVGYSHLKAELFGDHMTVSFTLSTGVTYSKTITTTTAAGKQINEVRIGGPSGVSSTGTSIFDNVNLYTTPEPASMLLLGLGGLLLRRRRA